MSDQKISAQRKFEKGRNDFHSISYTKSNISTGSWKTESSSDIHRIFSKFNERFFWGCLVGVELEWSKRMTRSAGLCVYRPKKNYCCIRLSAPLLSLRPHSDLIDTLLHEMIHAYLFVTKDRESDSHGSQFCKHMKRINKEAGTNITVYHTFHSEVNLYRQHWWRCDGPCRNWGPFFGMVKRSINRVPGPCDSWWRSHSAKCGGHFIKIREPIEYTRKKSKDKFYFEQSGVGNNLINVNKNSSFTPTSSLPGFIPPSRKYNLENIIEFVDLTSIPSQNILPVKSIMKNRRSVNSTNVIDLTDVSEQKKSRKSTYDICQCPVCGERLGRGSVNEHLEICDDLQTLFDDNQAFTDEFNFDDSCSKIECQQCPICAVAIHDDLAAHISECLKNSGIVNIFNEPILPFQSTNNLNKNNINVSSSKSTDPFNSCPVCSLEVSGDMNSHLEDGCLKMSGILDDLDFPFDIANCELPKSCNASAPVTKLSFSDINIIDNMPTRKELIICPVCASDIKNDMTSHVKECLSNSGLFDDLS